MFEGAHGFFVAFLAVEELADVPGCAEFLEVLHAQHVGLLDVLDAEVLVALEQRLEDGARRDLADAVLEHDIVVVVRVVVDAVLDLPAEEIALALARAPALADVRLHVDDAERREEAVVDALPQAVGVDGLAEVVDVRDVGRLLRRGRHADLDGRVEVVEDLAPPTVGFGRAAVTLVDDDEVEEVGPEELAEALFVVFAEELLVEREVDFVRRDRRAVVGCVVDLVDDTCERSEILLDRLVDEDVAVGEVEDFLPELCLAQPVDDLESRVRLARARRHDEQQALLSAGNRIERAVDGNTLIVARRKRALRHIERLLDDPDLLLRQVAFLLEPCDEFGRRRERIERELAFDARQEVVLDEAVTVRAVGERKVHHLSIRLGLLHAKRNRMVVVLRLDDRQRMA